MNMIKILLIILSIISVPSHATDIKEQETPTEYISQKTLFRICELEREIKDTSEALLINETEKLKLGNEFNKLMAENMSLGLKMRKKDEEIKCLKEKCDTDYQHYQNQFSANDILLKCKVDLENNLTEEKNKSSSYIRQIECLQEKIQEEKFYSQNLDAINKSLQKNVENFKREISDISDKSIEKTQQIDCLETQNKNIANKLASQLKENFDLNKLNKSLALDVDKLSEEIEAQRYLSRKNETELNKTRKENLNIKNLCDIYEIKIKDYDTLLSNMLFENNQKIKELEDHYFEEKFKILQAIKLEKQKEFDDRKKRDEVYESMKVEMDQWISMHKNAHEKIIEEKKNVEKIEQQRLQQEEAFKEKDKTGKNLEAAAQQVGKETQRVVSQTNREVKRIFKKF